MKTKHFLFALAAPLIAAACTNDEFADNAVNLDQRETISTEGFKLGAGFGDAQTRMGFGGEAGDESLTWKLDKTGAETDRLGLCLILNNAAQTNYEYLVNTLYGATTENTYVVKNGSFEPAAIRQADQEIVTESGNVRYAPQADFGTENATIFTGNYVAYYPYNTKFNEASATIPVSVASIQEAGDCTDNGYVGNYAFYISDPYQIKGGDTEANFVMRQVLPILRFEMKNTGNSALEISQIQVTAEGGMPLTATVDAALSGQVSMSNIHVGEAEEGDMQLLAFDGLNIAVDRQGKNVTYAYMTVLPGNYKNLTVKVILTDGNYMEKVIENANLTTLGTIQPIELEIDANKVEEGNPYGQVVSAADLKKALEEAGGRTSGSVEINILKNIEGLAANLFPASAMNGRASVTVKGGKITVTDAYTSSAAVDNVTFENAIEFKNSYTTSGGDDVVFAGPTTFKGAVTLTDGSSVSIAGTANVAGEIKVGTATGDAAMLNILEEGTLNAAGNVTYTSGEAHAINVEGTLNLNGNAQTGVPSVLTLNSDNVINLSGTLNINNASATIENGKWNVGNGTLVNNGELNIITSSAILDPKSTESPLDLTNNGVLSVKFDEFEDWAEGKVDVTNAAAGVYELSECSIPNLKTIVKNEDGKYADVKAIATNALMGSSNDIELTEELVDMADYTVTLNLDGNSGEAKATIKVAAGKTWTVNTLNVVVTDNNTNAGTVEIMSDGTDDTEAAYVDIKNLNVMSSETDFEKAVVSFEKSTDATVGGVIGMVVLNGATLDLNGEDGNTVKVTSSKVPAGTIKP